MPSRSALLIVIAGSLWGTAGTAQAIGGLTGSDLGVGAARTAIAGAVFTALALLLWTRGRSAGRDRTPFTRKILGYAAAAALCMAMYQTMFFVGVAHTGVTAGTLVAVGSAPILAGAIAAVAGRTPSQLWLLATALVVSGLTLLTFRSGTQWRPGGVAAALAAALAYVGYTVCVRKLLALRVAPINVLAFMFGGGSLCAMAFAAIAGPDLITIVHTGRSGLLTVLFLGIVSTVLPYLAWVRGVGAVSTPVATTLSLSEPLTAALLGLLLLREPYGALGAIGTACIGLGLVVAVAGEVRTSAIDGADAVS